MTFDARPDSGTVTQRLGKAPLPPWLVVTAGLMLILCLLGGGAWFFNVQQWRQRQEVETRLLSIANLKANQIADWRAEREADAAVLMSQQGLIRNAVDFLAGSGSITVELLKSLKIVKKHHQYSDIALVDDRRNVRLSLSGTRQLPGLEISNLQAAFKGGKPVWTALHVGTEHPASHLSIIAPLFAETTPEQPVGALVLLSDALSVSLSSHSVLAHPERKR